MWVVGVENGMVVGRLGGPLVCYEKPELFYLETLTTTHRHNMANLMMIEGCTLLSFGLFCHRETYICEEIMT